MLRRLRGECSQDVWRPIDFRITTTVSAPPLLLFHPWNRLLPIQPLLLSHGLAFGML